MTMKTAYVVILSVLLLLVSACAQKVNNPADVQAVKKSMDDFVKAVNAADAGAIAALMTEKTVYADLNVPVAVGAEAIQSLWQAFFGNFKFDLTAPVEDVRVVDGLAVARGSFTAKLTPKAEGVAVISNGGSWIVTFARQNDGSWKWDWCVPNSNQPLPGSTASGEDEQALYQLERDWAAAMVKKDAVALDNLLASEFQANYADFVTNKKQFLAAIKSGTAKFESMTTSEMQAFVFGDTAIVHGLSTAKSSMAGRDTSGQQRYTDVFVKRDGRWQCVTGYSTKVQ
jgi:ketosteroid isomerase-like protein